MNWTEQQLEAITTKGSDILVSAAAGSGKTAVLTERIRRLVTEEQIPLEKMLVVTFTNAAAGEMKGKILDSLREAEAGLGEQSDADSERGKKKKMIRKQIRNASSAEICTFHRFAMDVIRRYFFLTDIDPHFTICEESYGGLLREKCLNEMFEEKYESAEPDFLAFMDAYSELSGESKVWKMILYVYDFIMNMPDPFDWLHHHIEELNCTTDQLEKSQSCLVLAEGIRKDISRALLLAENLMQQTAQIPELDDRSHGKKTLFQKIEENAEKIRELVVHSEQLSLEELSEQMNNIKWVVMRASAWEKESYEPVKEQVKNQTDKYKKLIKQAQARIPNLPMEESAERVRQTYPSAVVLEELVAEFAERFTAVKREKNMLDFNDVEHAAYRILSSSEHPEAAEEYRQQFEVIFIDEYQDSSRIQEAMIRCISRGDNVYMVGDVKQSIYKFRQADPDLFIRKYNGYEEGSLPGIRIDLSKNFRSKGGVIDAVNGVFRHIMTRELSGIAYDEAAELVQGSGYERGGVLDYGVSLHLADTATEQSAEKPVTDDPAGEEVARYSRAEMEGEMIARLVEERLGRLLFDDKKGEERPAGYGDFVVLVRSRRNMEIYARALMNRGIPAYTSGGDGFYQAPEVKVMTDLLKVLNNFRNDKELISVLYSSLEGFCFTANELAEIRILNREGTFCEAFFGLADAEESSVPEEQIRLVRHCAQAAAQLRDWRKEVHGMPLDDFIWKLMMDTGYYGFVSALPGGSRRASNLRLLADRAGEYVRNQGGGLFSFLRFVDLIDGKDVRISQAVNPGDTSRMVQIMTIHNSKGLEFPIVIVPDLSAKIRHDQDNIDLQLHKDLGIAMKYRSREQQIEYRTLPYDAIIQVKRDEDFEEEKRILYVAMTRAKDELILTAARDGIYSKLEEEKNSRSSDDPSPDQRLSWIFDYAEEAGIPVTVYSREDLAGELREEEKQTRQFMEDLEKGFPDFVDENGLLGIIQKRLSFSYPYKRDSAVKSKYSVTELNRTMNGGESGPNQYIQVSCFQMEEGEADPAEEKRSEEAMSVSGSRFGEDASAERMPAFLSGKASISPAQRGVIIHRVLELMDYSADQDEEQIRAFCYELEKKGVFSPGELSVVPFDRIAAFFSSELGQRACRADRRRNEWAFTLRKKTAGLAADAVDPETARRLKENLPEEILVQGIIDCCFRDEKGIVIVDFKTDHVRASDRSNDYQRFREKYRRQLAFYREAVEREYGEQVDEMYLYLLDDSTALPISL